MLEQTPPGESLCEFCSRPWFGQVAYCPYCGRQASKAAKQKSSESHQAAQAAASGSPWAPADAAPLAAPEIEHKELEAALAQGAPAVPPPRRRPSFPPLHKEPDGDRQTEHRRPGDEAVAGF